jgi:hypothetical protein
MTRNIPDLVLERYRLDELPETSARAVAQMVAADPALQARLDALARSDADIRAQYSPLISIHDRRAPSRRLVVRALTAATLGATALLVFAALPRTPSQPTVTERIKGGRPSLALYRRTPSGSERLADGDVARTGDLLRVGYASAGRAYGVIFSIDGRGTVTLHLPPAGDESASLEKILVPGKPILLDRAYELDDAPRIERFYFVTGARPFAVAPVLAAARAAAAAPEKLPLPAGLEQVTFAIQKEARK